MAVVSASADFTKIDGGITAPKGFKAAGMTAGLKASGLPDFAAIFSETDAVAGGVFTTCRVCAAPVTYCREAIKKSPSSIRAVVINSGQANAATGDDGWKDAIYTSEAASTALGVPSSAILLASTGVIGQRIKLKEYEAALPTLFSKLGSDEASAAAAAKAIMTTDLVPKTVAFESTLSNGMTFRVGGMCKGSGMIHPNMATMLAFLTCDAKVAPALWQSLFSRAADKSFNQVTVDGDTSTNDTFVGLANGAADPSGPAISDPTSADALKVEAMVTAASQYLAKCIARDGEGATVLFETTVTGGATDADARLVARTIIGSSLVKSAVFGRDPNWGRIAAAAGRAGVDFDQRDLRIELGPFVLMDKGQPLPFDRKGASEYMKTAAAGEYLVSDTVAVKVSIGSGPGSGVAYGCDLTYDYVKINAEYTT
eukprot:CAMPEP_0184675182 /NCGR_PEP_ID=MMETSP0308-20130426/87648_1 /TAXON_ID=38269 /ORGANISM="Gloeochaete witrockiana, Strain SAG 46.84" /LENGTH=426 /DNA_ID=CAMNT_0027122865 /DNA_START=286 /DNA_END=1566 /DNA_ORIENTATION=+